MSSYRDAECEAGDDVVLGGERVELERGEVAGEDEGDGAQRVLCDGGEDGRPRQEPQPPVLLRRVPQERTHAPDLLQVLRHLMLLHLAIPVAGRRRQQQRLPQHRLVPTAACRRRHLSLCLALPIQGTGYADVSNSGGAACSATRNLDQ